MIFSIFFHRAIQGAQSMSRAISKKHNHYKVNNKT